ncbi:head GIN domain-containing protein [Gaoshiqia sp. Z1-71]|uniref:head GIN domain-containing protein n=1 Tax=Gaoshiqia hydrogeniformans TaxID=3290090 RepID=UPI003BF82972
MMRKIRLSLVLLTATVFFTACYTGAKNREEQTVKIIETGDFNKLRLEGSFRVVLEQSDKAGLRIKTYDETLENITVSEDGHPGELKISRERFDMNRVTLYVSFTRLEEIRSIGGLRLETKGYLDLADFRVHAEGGAVLKMELKADQLTITGEGGVCLNLKGVAKTMEVRISGAGFVNTGELRAEYVNMKVEGMTLASVHATDSLTASIEGMGKIKYKDDPKVDKNIEGLGKIIKD